MQTVSRFSLIKILVPVVLVVGSIFLLSSPAFGQTTLTHGNSSMYRNSNEVTPTNQRTLSQFMLLQRVKLLNITALTEPTLESQLTRRLMNG